jgi:hypothetical protein
MNFYKHVKKVRFFIILSLFYYSIPTTSAPFVHLHLYASQILSTHLLTAPFHTAGPGIP